MYFCVTIKNNDNEKNYHKYSLMNKNKNMYTENKKKCSEQSYTIRQWINSIDLEIIHGLYTFDLIY